MPDAASHDIAKMLVTRAAAMLFMIRRVFRITLTMIHADIRSLRITRYAIYCWLTLVTPSRHRFVSPIVLRRRRA